MKWNNWYKCSKTRKVTCFLKVFSFEFVLRSQSTKLDLVNVHYMGIFKDKYCYIYTKQKLKKKNV